MEVSDVRRQVQQAMAKARERAQRRRQQAADAEVSYQRFLSEVATPVVKQIANALKAEGYAFTVSTPGRGVQLVLDRGRDDFIEIALDTEQEEPSVVARVSRTRGSRTIHEERALGADAAIDALTETDVLTFIVSALGPWLER